MRKLRVNEEIKLKALSENKLFKFSPADLPLKSDTHCAKLKSFWTIGKKPDSKPPGWARVIISLLNMKNKDPL